MLNENDVKHAKNLIKILVSDSVEFKMNGIEAFGLGTALNWLLSIEKRMKDQAKPIAPESVASKPIAPIKKKTKKVTKKK